MCWGPWPPPVAGSHVFPVKPSAARRRAPWPKPGAPGGQVSIFGNKVFWARPCTQRHPESCAITRAHSPALLVLVFSLLLLNGTGYTGKKALFAARGPDPGLVTVTCGFPTVPSVSVQANDKKLAFLRIPKGGGTQAEVESTLISRAHTLQGPRRPGFGAASSGGRELHQKFPSANAIALITCPRLAGG